LVIRAVIFDLFDTLVDLHYDRIPREHLQGRPLPPTTRLLHGAVSEHMDIGFEAFVEIAREVDREVLGPRYAEDLEVPTEERFTALVERLGLDAPGLPVEMTRLHMGVLRDQVEVPSHHVKILAGLAGRVRLGVCSNFSHSETALSILAASGIDRHLETIVISDAIGFRKPRPEIFTATLERLGVRSDEALHVGDNLHADVRGAAGAGVPSAWITRRVHDAEQRLRDHDGPAPDYVIADLAELAGVLDASGS
jgi:FMN phosphatase YigB (HAD superfamily)